MGLEVFGCLARNVGNLLILILEIILGVCFLVFGAYAVSVEEQFLSCFP